MAQGIRQRLAARLLAILVAGVLLGPATGALAHGELPAGRAIYVSEAGEILGGGTTYGVLLLEDGVPMWSAEEALEDVMRWTHWVADPGRILAGGFRGLWASEDGGCSWSEVPGILEGHHIPGLAVDPLDRERLFVATATSALPNGLFVRPGPGAAFEATGLDDAGAFLRAVVVTPGADRIFVSGIDAEDYRPVIFVSDDGGESFRKVEDDFEDWVSVRLLSHSHDTEALYLAARDRDGVDHLLVTPDDLETLTPVVAFERDRQITHFVDHPPYRYVVIDRNRLHRDVGDGDFEEITDTPFPTRCFEPFLEDGRLWACGQLRDRAHFLVTEDGEAWEPVLRYEDVRMRECADGTPGAELNPRYWPAVQAWGVGPPISSGNGENGNGNGTDPEDPPPIDNGCDCAMAGTGVHAAWLLLIAAAWPKRRRVPARAPGASPSRAAR